MCRLSRENFTLLLKVTFEKQWVSCDMERSGNTKVLIALFFFIMSSTAFACTGHEQLVGTVKKFVAVGDCFAVGEVTLQLGEGIEDIADNLDIPVFSGMGEGRKPIIITARLFDNESISPLTAVADKSNAYQIQVSPAGIVITGVDRTAVLYAFDMFSTILSSGNGKLTSFELLDWANLHIRALHFVLRNVSLDDAKDLINKARAERFNTIIIHLADGVRFDADISYVRGDALTKGEFVDLVNYIRMQGLEFVPQVALLTHQEKFFRQRYPELMYNNATYDPRIPRVYELVFAYLDELIDTVSPSVIHIGHDEVKGLTHASRKKWLKAGEKPLPPNLYLDDLLRVNNYLLGQEIEVWMWGDMFIDSADYPDMHVKNFHGIQGYSEIRAEIPENIVIADWHYHHEGADFPSVEAFTGLNHDVLGSTWKKEKNIRLFAEYMANAGPRSRGMIATTWFHVQKKEWGMVDWIIQESGRWYWQAAKKVH